MSYRGVFNQPRHTFVRLTFLAFGYVERVRGLHLAAAVHVRIVERRAEHERLEWALVVGGPVDQTDFACLTAAGVELGAVRMAVEALLAGHDARFARLDAQLGGTADLRGEEARAEQLGGYVGWWLEIGTIGRMVGHLFAGGAAVLDHGGDCVGVCMWMCVFF